MSRVQVTKNVFIGGEKGLQRLSNLEKIAELNYNGNFSEMVNDLINKIFNLDPNTGDLLPERMRKYCLCEAEKCKSPAKFVTSNSK